MRVKSLKLQNFPAPEMDRELNLPERGVVLVTGPNGSGKSSFMEALAWAVWGKTLRGQKPATPKPTVHVTNQEGGWIERDGDKLKFGGTCEGDPVQFATRMRTHEHLANLFGTWDEWRRTHVFSSSDSAAFASASDGERKRLVEKILGLEKFDEALSAVREDLTKIKADNQRAFSAKLVAEAKAQEAGKRVKDMERALDSLPKYTDEAALESQLRVEETTLTMQRARVEHAEKMRHEHALAAQRWALQASQHRKATTLAEAGQCPTCGTALDKAHPCDLQALKDQLAEAELQEKVNHDAAQGTWVQQIAAEKKTEALITQRLATLRQELKQVKKLDMTKIEMSAQMAKAAQERAELEAGGDQARQIAEETAKAITILQGCEKVLGLKGARTLVLERAMEAVGEAADSWLKRLSDGQLGIKLSLDHDEGILQLQVEGAGGGEYAGCSGGQRRRIDLAVLLALANTAAAITGRPAGTLWLDEVFDALDADGIQAAAEAVRSLAEERCCVVITHVTELEDALKPDVHVRL